MTSTTTKKPRAARRRRKTTPKPMTEQSYPVTKEEAKVELPKPTDDIIAMVTKSTKYNGWQKVIVSSDKDLMQLVG